MEQKEINRIIEQFIHDLNHMCTHERKDFLVREKMVTYEHGSSLKVYQVTYKLKKKKNVWLIDAYDKGFWIFKSRFPLLRVTRTDNTINFAGMFTQRIYDFEIVELEKKLAEYLETCKKQPTDVFTKS